MAEGQRTKVERVCQSCGATFFAYPWDCRRREVKYCSRSCYYASKRIPIEEQFRRSVGETTESGCVLWAGLKDWNGRGVIYSTLRPPQRIFIASRIAWEIANGAIPEGQCICHRCDNPACINVAHLFLGTQLDNIDDMARKGRQANRRLTDDEIRTIYARYHKGNVSQQQLADEYGIHQTAVSSIVTGKRWQYVTQQSPR
jgi:HNH endonuclease